MIPLEYLALRTLTNNATIASVLELTDGVRYAVGSFAPSVAPLRAATLGGQSEYDEAVDTFTVYALGATAARAVANAETLAGVLDQAARWARGDDVLAIAIAVRVQQATAGTLQALCLGPAEPDTPPFTIDPQHNVLDTYPGTWSQAVEVAVRRRGLWYGEAISTAGPVTFVANSGVVTAFATASPARTPIASLLRLSTTTSVPAGDTLPESVLIVSGEPTAIVADTWGSDAAPPTGFTQVNDAANLPVQGTFVLRFTPATANPATTDLYTLITPTGGGTDSVIALYATARTNTVNAAISFLLTPRVTLGNGATYTARPVEVPASSTSPRIIPLGIIPVPFLRTNTAFTVSLTVQAVGGTTVTLDLDSLVAVGLTSQTAVLTIPQVTLSTDLNGNVILVADPCDLQGTLAEPVGAVNGDAQGVPGRRPLVYAVERNPTTLEAPQPLAYLGTMPQCDGANLSAYWLSVNPPYWEYVPTTARVSHSLTFSRRLAYRTPQ